MISPSQCRAARALLNLKAADLSDMTREFNPNGSVSRATISAFEKSPDLNPAGSAASVLYICQALEAAGVQFVKENSRPEGLGVALAAKSG